MKKLKNTRNNSTKHISQGGMRVPNGQRLPDVVLQMPEIFLFDMNAYMNSVASGTNLNQTTDTYTNIHGGVGIFAARRTHLYKYLLADNSMNPINSSNPGLRAYLTELGVGF